MGLQIREPRSYPRTMVAVEKPGNMYICNLNTALERAPSHTPATAETVLDLVKRKSKTWSLTQKLDIARSY